MDEDQVVCPAAPGTTALEYPIVRAARHDGRDGTSPSPPVRGRAMQRPAEDPASAEGEQDSKGLRVAVGRKGPVWIVTVTGELDHDSADGLRTALSRPGDDGIERIVVDLADLRFCNSAGLNILLRARIETEAARLRLELAGLRPIVARVFGVDGVLRIHPDLKSALNSAGGPSADGGERDKGGSPEWT
ncbi:STAS domain-containing protein [Kitasatospora sp. NPDC058190]|uniref:STAS domain-containing protein n=1 Tax=Kitasatospora sp. NPDC058190 TaxID=3346371 RepID=UPI0036DD31D3